MTTTEFKNEWIGFSTPEIEEQFDIDLTDLINDEIQRRINNNPIDAIKKEIAEQHGYRNDILGRSWDYAMLLTHRTKRQIKLYEEVLILFKSKLLKSKQ